MAEEKKEEQKQEKDESESPLKPEQPAWKPRTELGRKVLAGEIKDIREILESGQKILEPEIVDYLIPNLKSELILIGGRSGKGGGIQRIPIRITAKMHHSGRRYTMTAFAVVGNEDGIVGIGKGRAKESRLAIEKAIKNAKKNLILVPRGCGSWECGCGGDHSIPYKTTGKCGSVRVTLMPAPKGVGLVADDETKKILRLAGIKDVWVKTLGDTGTRINLITAVYRALKKLHAYKRPKKKGE
ncbi:MAG: 30S ribosomal protein S5 [Candidatus Aenigmarchaeota archaeon]|nr:30S ribosomal protein S5 [Candidatus Aenigmarchaeota archaeon]